MIKFRHKGSFKHAEKFLENANRRQYLKKLDVFGREGVAALSAYTPVASGKTAESWDYEIHWGHGNVTIYWTNSNFNDNVPIAVILQYGHGTGTGGYVQGIDYINPALKDVFRHIADAAWEELTK